MLGFENHARRQKGIPAGIGNRTGFSIGTINRLERPDFQRDARLLDASVAGVILTYNPRDAEMRAPASLAWQAIRAMLAPSLLSKKSGFPWANDKSVSSRTMAELLEKRYSEIRLLAQTVNSISFEHGSDAEVSTAGKALCRLAVKLDDLMDEAERRFMTKLREYVFTSGEEARFSA